MVKLLIENEADLNVVNKKDDESALILAIDTGNLLRKSINNCSAEEAY